MKSINLMQKTISLIFILASVLGVHASVLTGPCETLCQNNRNSCLAEARAAESVCKADEDFVYDICVDFADINLHDCLDLCGGVGQPTCGECNVAHFQDVQDCQATRQDGYNSCHENVYLPEATSCSLEYSDCLADCSHQ
jgi:hypothetical protein